MRAMTAEERYQAAMRVLEGLLPVVKMTNKADQDSVAEALRLIQEWKEKQ